MPQVQIMVRRDTSLPRPAAASHDGGPGKAGAYRADTWSKIFYTGMKKVLSPLCQAFRHPAAEGLDNIPADGPAILASNHLPALDSAFIALASQRRVTFLAKSEYFNTPGLRGLAGKVFVAATGQISVDRNNRRRATEALQAGAHALHQGELLGIFPEGTRSPDGRVYRGKLGVARLAMATGAPVIPVELIGTFQVLPLNRRLPRSGRVHLRVGTPLRFPVATGESAVPAQRAATDQIMKAIQELSGQCPADMYADRFKASLRLAGHPPTGGADRP
jgi:1-acyl-sn-glycerol-3-phosphate acyltransferase